MDPSQLPAGVTPQMMAALQQSGASGGNLMDIVNQLAQMPPEQVAQLVSQLTGQEVTPEDIADHLKDWIEKSAGKASGDSESGDSADAAAEGERGPGTPPSPTGPAPSAPTADEEMAQMEGEAADPDASSEGMEAQAAASPADVAAAQSPSGAGEDAPMPAAMPAAMPRGGAGRMPTMPKESDIQSAISASMGGDVPRGPRAIGPGGPRMSGPAAPRGAPPSSGNSQDMIRQMYRQAAAAERGVAQTGVKRGPRTGGTAGVRREKANA